MYLIKLKDIYDFGRISQQNGKPWVMVKEFIDSQDIQDDSILVDFEGIDVVEPWKNSSFKDLLVDPRVNFKCYNRKEFIDNINILCILDGLKRDRVENVEYEVKKELTPKEKQAIKKFLDMHKYIHEDGDKAVFKVLDYVTTLTNISTVKKIKESLRLYIQDKSVSNVVVDLTGVDTNETVIGELAISAQELKRDFSVNMDIEGVKPSYKEKYGLFMFTAINKTYSIQDKLNTIRKVLKPYTPGMLAKYVKTRGLDEFGRMGKGMIAVQRPAIFLGLSKPASGDIEDIVLIFVEFPVNTFYTKQHQVFEEYGVVRSKLECEKVKLKLNEVGVYDYFFGSRGHFSRPIQDKPGNSTAMSCDAGDGFSKSRTYTIPQRMKAVWDDYGIKYNKEELDYCINETNRILSESELKE